MKLIMGTGGRGEGNGEHHLISPVIVFFFFSRKLSTCSKFICQFECVVWVDWRISRAAQFTFVNNSDFVGMCLYLPCNISECALVHLGIVLISLPYLSGQGSEFHTSVRTCEVGNLEIYRLGVYTTRLVLINELYYELNTINNIAW